MKEIRNYMVLITMTLLLIFFSLFSVLFIDYNQLPSDHWSKELKLTDYEQHEDFSTKHVPNFSMTSVKDKFYLTYFSNDKLYLKVFSKTFEVIDEKVIMDSIDNIRVYKGIEISHKANKFLIYLNKNDSIEKIVLDDQLRPSDHEVLYNQIDEPIIKSNSILYTKNESLYMNDEEITDAQGLNAYDFIYDQGIYYIAFMKYDLDQLKRYLYISEVKKSRVSTHLVSEYNFIGGIRLYHLKVNRFMEHTGILFVTGDFKSGQYKNHEVILNNKSKIISEKSYAASGSEPILVNQSSLDCIQSTPTTIGRQDLSTKGKQFTNLVKFSDGEKYPLTKTTSFSPKTKFFQDNRYEYLLFTQYDDNNIYLSSNNPEVIDQSQKLSLKSFGYLALLTLTNFAPMVLFFFINFGRFVTVVLLILFPLYIIKMYWVDDYRKIVLSTAVVVMMALKLHYIIFQMNLPNMPAIMNSTISHVCICFLLSFSAYIATRDIRIKYHLSVIYEFLIFALLDMIYFTLFFTTLTTL
jgi:hypothetical protein